MKHPWHCSTIAVVVFTLHSSSHTVVNTVVKYITKKEIDKLFKYILIGCGESWSKGQWLIDSLLFFRPRNCLTSYKPPYIILITLPLILSSSYKRLTKSLPHVVSLSINNKSSTHTSHLWLINTSLRVMTAFN